MPLLNHLLQGEFVEQLLRENPQWNQAYETYASVIHTPRTENLLRNGSFEWPDNNGWSDSYWAATPLGSSAREPWAKRTCNRGVGIYGWLSARAVTFYQDVEAQAGNEYLFTIWAARERHYNEVSTELRLWWLDAEGNRIGDQPAARRVITGETGQEFQNFQTSTEQAPNNVAMIRVEVYARWDTSMEPDHLVMKFDDAVLTSIASSQ